MNTSHQGSCLRKPLRCDVSLRAFPIGVMYAAGARGISNRKDRKAYGSGTRSGLEATGRACAKFLLKIPQQPRLIGISGDSANHLGARYKWINGETS